MKEESVIKNDIAFLGQLGDYVIHGAIEKIIEYFRQSPSAAPSNVEDAAENFANSIVQTSQENWKMEDQIEWEKAYNFFKAGWQASQKEDRGFSEWQICPKCGGNGLLNPPYEVRGTAVVTGICDVCKGTKILAKPPITEQKK